jgi:uncharacterized protein (TIGR02284 family)
MMNLFPNAVANFPRLIVKTLNIRNSLHGILIGFNKNHKKNINMENSNETLLTLLNQLVQINNDRIEGYETAEKETKDNDLKILFAKFRDQSQKYRSELAAHVTRLGGEPKTGTNHSGKLYRVWMDMKAALTGNDRKGILNSCEFGEDVALGTYKTALESGVTLPGEVSQLVQRQKSELQQSHDSVKALRDSSVSAS